MASVKIGTFEVSSFKVGTKDPKIYLGDILLYPLGGYKICYAVVDDITQYSETEFEDVYDKATEKWYKLNNLDQYEEYGIYASGRTSCEGSTSRLPQGYTEVEYVENTSTAYIDTGAYLNTSNFEVGYAFWGDRAQWGYVHQNVANGAWVTAANDYAYMGRWDSSYRVAIDSYLTSDENTIVYTQSGVTVNGTSISKNLNLSGTDNLNASTLLFFAWYDFYRAGVEHSFNSKVKSFYLKNNGTLVRDFVPAKRDSDNKYGMYDIVNDVFYLSPNNVDFSGGSPVTPTDCVTTYNGKLTIDGDYEYQYSGGSWINVGEVSGSTASLPDVPFVLNYNAANYDASTHSIPMTTGQLNDTDAVAYNNPGNIVDHSEDGYITISNSSMRIRKTGQDISLFNRQSTSALSDLTIVCKAKSTGGENIITNRDGNYNWMYRLKTSGQLRFHGNSETGSIAWNTSNPDVMSVRTYYDSGTKIKYNNWTQNTSTSPTSFSYGSTNGDSSSAGALFVGYGWAQTVEQWSGDFYWVYMAQANLTDAQIQEVIAYNEGGGGQSEYPVYYDEKSDPLDNLTFSSMTEANTYAYNNCVYDGMIAIIDGSKYRFDSEDGWVVVPEYYKVEDVTPNQASGWTISGSATYNPDSSYYDDFDLVTTSTTSSYKIAKVTIYGYDHFTYYLRSYNGYSSSYGYLMASNIDELSSAPTSMSYNSSFAITNTWGLNVSPSSDVNLNNYRRVTYNNIDKTVEHTFYVVFYGRTYSSYISNATILIPKEQINEQWEQVTFSASSNVASSQKNLYIDGSSTSNGGTQCWYYRWIVGLPSGSHSSYTNHSSYNYCPNVTSSTFTSVAGEQRQVNFTYNDTTNKTLSFRLTDGNGNVLTPSNTVFYNMAYYNSCGVSSSSSNITFPRSQDVKVGGRFRFANSSNRHYIYGYTPPTLGTTYYVDNYSSTFDIVYTALTREAVTVTYTTYDPNDSETPAFKTDITWPYNGGTTSSTTLTSYAVPYTYPYEVSQTSDKFSADSQSYTAGQAARTINFVLYPNNREFATVADMEAYAYAWEGMKAEVNGTNYQYKNGQWVEQSYNQYEYIRTANLATSYYRFNTNFYPTTANTLEVKFEMTDRSVDWGAIIEWRPGGTQNFEFDTVTASYQAIVRTGGNGGVTYRPTIGKDNVTVYTLPLSATSGTYSVNGGSTQTIQYNYTAMSLPATIPMGIFGGPTSTDLKAAVGKLYYVKVYDGNGNLVKHYVPSDYNGTPCLYEIVDGDYILDTYTGTNHGTLTLGPSV